MIRLMRLVPHKDPEARRAYGRDWMKRNADRARDAMRRWRAAHPETDRANKRDYYARNVDAERARGARYLQSHPEVARVKAQNRSARERAGVGRYSTREWLELVAAYGGRCGYCGLRVPLSADHRVPLIRGGPHTIDNIIPACRPCNSRKGRLTEREFRDRLANERWKSSDFEVVDWWRAGEIEWVS